MPLGSFQHHPKVNKVTLAWSRSYFPGAFVPTLPLTVTEPRHFAALPFVSLRSLCNHRIVPRRVAVFIGSYDTHYKTPEY